MVAITRNLWDRLGPGEDLRFPDSLPFLLNVPLYKKNLTLLVGAVYKKSLKLFPDIEATILSKAHPEIESRLRSRDPLAIYLHEVKGFGGSDREEEYVLARCLEIAKLVLQREVMGLPSFPSRNSKKTTGPEKSVSHLQEIFRKIREGKWESSGGPRLFRNKLGKAQQRMEEMNQIRSLLISRNLHLVPKFARRFRNFGVPYQDLIQEGNTSLLRAADKFDWKRGVRFSTYAQWWINQAMLKSLYCQSRVVRLPVYLNQKMKKIRDANQESWGENGQDMTAEEISKNLSEPVGRIRRALRANVGTYSLDQALEKNEGASLKDLLVDRHVESSLDSPEGPPLPERIAELLHRLSDKERQILVFRYGLEGNSPRTLDEVSKIFRVSRERIRQIQVQALRKLLQPSKKQNLASFLN